MAVRPSYRPVMIETMRRVTEVLGHRADAAPAELHVQAAGKSFLVSADMAHAYHPNYPDKHDPALQPKLGGGMVIKTNLEQRYATSAVSAFFFRAAGAKADAGASTRAVRSSPLILSHSYGNIPTPYTVRLY